MLTMAFMAAVLPTMLVIVATTVVVIVIAQEVTRGRMSARQAWGVVLMTLGLTMMWWAWARIVMEVAP